MRDPFALLVIIFAAMSCSMDGTAWEVSDVFGKMERVSVPYIMQWPRFNWWQRALMLSQERESFTGLHNVAKHIVYLQESCDATCLIVQKVLAHFKLLQSKASDENKVFLESTWGMLTQAETSFEAINLRLRSLDRRMQSVIALVSLSLK
jgi:hypothetical protein